MKWSDVEGNWNEFKGLVKQQWGDLTDDDLQEIDGRRDRMIGKLQKLYDVSEERAEAMLSDGIDGIDIQGEGNYEAARRYQKEQHEFASEFTTSSKSQH
jgi:uncharacterized protein YjbJ (UPF0337 family)